MKTTSDERLEVAENLRHMAIYNDIRYYEQFFDELSEVAVGYDDYHSFIYVLNKLANFIDPTCKVESVEPIRYGEIDEKIMDVYKLTCGHFVVRQCGYTPPAYCDECGSRVVSYDE